MKSLRKFPRSAASLYNLVQILREVEFSMLSLHAQVLAMSVELYTKLCGWFLNWGTIDGVFCHSFLVLSWNLACRENVYLSDINWATYFDTFNIFFAHTKTDWIGNNAKYPRRLFANPMIPLICPVFALSLYFSCYYNSPLDIGSPLFPAVISTQDSEIPLVLVWERMRKKWTH